MEANDNVGDMFREDSLENEDINGRCLRNRDGLVRMKRYTPWHNVPLC